MKKLALFLLCFSFTISFIMPMVAVVMFSKSPEKVAAPENAEKPDVYSPELETAQTDGGPLEEYIKCVVCAEMPALFEAEALKAQAVAARTYTYRALQNGADISSPDNFYQAYISKDDLKDRWGSNFENYYGRVSSAVDATSGEIMVYDDEPILAVFHSTAAGATENSENIWTSPTPYLKSVESPWDSAAPNFEYTMSISKADIASRIKNKYPEADFGNSDIFSQIEILEKSPAGYVVKIRAGNIELKGNDFRMALGLRSAYFSLSDSGDSISFTTRGYGHGAGMSQYGANFMAADGNSYRDILTHYYSGISFKNIYKSE